MADVAEVADAVDADPPHGRPHGRTRRPPAHVERRIRMVFAAAAAFGALYCAVHLLIAIVYTVAEQFDLTFGDDRGGFPWAMLAGFIAAGCVAAIVAPSRLWR